MAPVSGHPDSAMHGIEFVALREKAPHDTNYVLALFYTCSDQVPGGDNSKLAVKPFATDIIIISDVLCLSTNLKFLETARSSEQIRVLQERWPLCNWADNIFALIQEAFL